MNYYPRERSLAEINVNEKVNVFAKKIIFAIENIFSSFLTNQVFVTAEIHRGSVTKLNF